MKTKKVLALVVLAAFLISIVPFAAFAAVTITGNFNPYASTVKVPSESVEAQNVSKTSDYHKEDGAEFTVVLNNNEILEDGTLQIAVSRPSISFLAVKKGGTWEKVGAFEGSALKYDYDVADGVYSHSIDFKVVSSAAGTTNVVFGNAKEPVQDLAAGREYSDDGSSANIIQQKAFPVQFTDARADKLETRLSDVTFDKDGKLIKGDVKDVKPANGVDTYKVQAFVYANNIPVAGKDVNFSIIKGNGLSLTATKATTDVTGKAEVKVYSTRATGDEAAVIQARTSGVKVEDWPGKVYVAFNTPGITSIKAESENNQKVARDAGKFEFKFSAYDAAGNRVNISEKELQEMTLTVVTKPSGSGISAPSNPGADNTNDSKSIYLQERNDNDAEIVINTDQLKKDGDYEVKVHLTNGSAVSYKFNAKEQGDVVKMELDYGATNYAGESRLPQPSIKYYDAEGYKVSAKYGEGKATTGNVKLSISDASFLDGTIDAKGQFTLKEDKSGVITMTAVDTVENLVATQVINVHKPASYLKLTPQSVGAVGGEVTVNIELVDVDGKLAASGRGAISSSATIIAKPEGAIASADSVSTSDFADGKASVKVSSNVEGDVTLQVIIIEKIEEDGKPDEEGKVYTGAATVSFGKASTGSGQVIFIVGAPSYVSGNQVFAAESPSFIDNGRTFLGVRDMGTSIGATIEWDQASQTATLSKDGVTIKVTVGANKIAVTKNGVTSEIEIDAPAQNKNGRVYLPFRAVMEAFNYTVTFDQATNSIVCTL